MCAIYLLTPVTMLEQRYLGHILQVVKLTLREVTCLSGDAAM